MSVKASNFIQIFTMAAKFIVLALIGIAGIYNIAIGEYGSLTNAFEGSSTSVGSYGVAFYTCMWSYGGWERVCQCFDEIKNPSKNIPIILMVSIVMTMTPFLQRYKLTRVQTSVENLSPKLFFVRLYV